MKVLCCGDRAWSNDLCIYDALRYLGDGTVVVHGACRGADRLCGRVAESLGYGVVSVPADWDTHGKAAGIIRNQKMLTDHPDIAFWFAFHNNLSESRGTADMVARLTKRGIPGINVKDTPDWLAARFDLF